MPAVASSTVMQSYVRPTRDAANSSRRSCIGRDAGTVVPLGRTRLRVVMDERYRNQRTGPESYPQAKSCPQATATADAKAPPRRGLAPAQRTRRGDRSGRPDAPPV